MQMRIITTALIMNNVFKPASAANQSISTKEKEKKKKRLTRVDRNRQIILQKR
jgi:hypothetical protein